MDDVPSSQQESQQDPDIADQTEDSDKKCAVPGTDTDVSASLDDEDNSDSGSEDYDTGRRRRGASRASSRKRRKRPSWTRHEEETLAELHCSLGNQWSIIASRLPGRTANEVKNIWHSTLRSKHLKARSLLRAYATALNGHWENDAARQEAYNSAIGQKGSSEGADDNVKAVVEVHGPNVAGAIASSHDAQLPHPPEPCITPTMAAQAQTGGTAAVQLALGSPPPFAPQRVGRGPVTSMPQAQLEQQGQHQPQKQPGKKRKRVTTFSPSDANGGDASCFVAATSTTYAVNGGAVVTTESGAMPAAPVLPPCLPAGRTGPVSILPTPSFLPGKCPTKDDPPGAGAAAAVAAAVKTQHPTTVEGLDIVSPGRNGGGNLSSQDEKGLPGMMPPVRLGPGSFPNAGLFGPDASTWSFPAPRQLQAPYQLPYAQQQRPPYSAGPCPGSQSPWLQNPLLVQQHLPPQQQQYARGPSAGAAGGDLLPPRKRSSGGLGFGLTDGMGLPEMFLGFEAQEEWLSRTDPSNMLLNGEGVDEGKGDTDHQRQQFANRARMGSDSTSSCMAKAVPTGPAVIVATTSAAAGASAPVAAGAAAMVAEGRQLAVTCGGGGGDGVPGDTVGANVQPAHMSGSWSSNNAKTDPQQPPATTAAAATPGAIGRGSNAGPNASTSVTDPAQSNHGQGASMALVLCPPAQDHAGGGDVGSGEDGFNGGIAADSPRCYDLSPIGTGSEAPGAAWSPDPAAAITGAPYGREGYAHMSPLSHPPTARPADDVLRGGAQPLAVLPTSSALGPSGWPPSYQAHNSAAPFGSSGVPGARPSMPLPSSFESIRQYAQQQHQQYPLPGQVGPMRELKMSALRSGVHTLNGSMAMVPVTPTVPPPVQLPPAPQQPHLLAPPVRAYRDSQQSPYDQYQKQQDFFQDQSYQQRPQGQNPGQELRDWRLQQQAALYQQYQQQQQQPRLFNPQQYQQLQLRHRTDTSCVTDVVTMGLDAVLDPQLLMCLVD